MGCAVPLPKAGKLKKGCNPFLHYWAGQGGNKYHSSLSLGTPFFTLNTDFILRARGARENLQDSHCVIASPPVFLGGEAIRLLPP